MSVLNDYGNYDALGLAELVRKREVSAQELLDEALARVERVNPRINAVIRPMQEQATSSIKAGLPDGPFSGVPFLIKDLMAAYAGVPMMQGSRFFRDYVPESDSELVKRFKRAGLVIFGKTATPEFGVTPITEPELTGPTRNPWNTEYTPNGSSGGSAAAVAARIVPMASGGDGGGSIRTPASACGLVGMKPSRGRNPIGPGEGEPWWGFAVEHALTRSVRDSAALLDATHGALPGAEYAAAAPQQSYLEATTRAPGKLRIAYSTDPILGRELDPECKAAVEKTAQDLSRLGHDVEEFTPPVARDDFIYAYAALVAADTSASIDMGEKLVGRKATRADFELRTWALRKIGRALRANEITACRWRLQHFAQTWCAALTPYDVFVTSALVRTPARIGALAPTAAENIQLQALTRLPLGKIATRRNMLIENSRALFDYSGMTMPANVTGQPSLSLPLHWSKSGLPVGVMFTGRYADEATLFQLAGQLEQAHPWSDKRPPVCADPY